MNLLSGFADISLLQLLLVAAVALFASVIGGLAGYGTGALMPLVLVPLIGAEPVVPIIAISSIFTNLSRFVAYVRYADRRKALIVIAAAVLTTALGHVLTLAEDAWLAADFPLAPAALAAIADQTVARFHRDHRL